MKKILSCAALAVALSASAVTLTENFSADPASNGWQAFGQTNLFAWNSTNQNLAVTWDSSQPNSYFHQPLGVTLTRTSDFLVSFDLQLSDIAIGVHAAKPFTFQIAIGLHNHASATNSAYRIGSGFEAPDIVELNYFPDSGYGATLSTPVISSANTFASGGFTYPFELQTNTLYHVAMIFTAADQTLRTTLTTNGVPAGLLQDTVLGETFDDFAVDTLSINSYSDDGQFPGYEGSVLAHGTVDNLAFASPLPVTTFNGNSIGNHWRTSLFSQSDWLYTLERSTNLTSWAAVTAPTPGNGGNLTLSDTNPPPVQAVYRVRAELP